MTLEADLQRAVRAHGARIVDRGSAQFRREVLRDRVTPEDAGTLKLGLRIGPVVSRGATIECEFTSRAKAMGFDYPAFINAVPRIVPTKRKYLAWQGRDGGMVFSKGFTNRHRGWWKKTVTARRWVASVRHGALLA